MVLLRLLSAAIEVGAVVILARLDSLAEALKVNAFLGLIGPAIFLLVSSLGLIGLADQVGPGKLVIIACGVGLILWGIRS